jgi:CheY-like chemotaxis protein
VTTRVLERYGYRVFSAPDGVAALALWPQLRNEVQLLITDVVMPGGISGHQLARQLRQENIHLKVLFTSGYDAERAGRSFETDPNELFLQKPASIDQLLAVVATALTR